MTRSTFARLSLALGLVSFCSALLTFLANPYSLADHGALTVVGWGLSAKLLVGATGVFTGLVVGTADKLRRVLAGRAAGFAAWTLVSGALVALALCGLGVAATRVGWRWDLTANRIHSITPESLAVLRALDGEILAEAFFSPQEPQAEQVREVLARYAAATPRFRFEMVDPFRAPERLGKLGITRSGPRIFLRRGDAFVAVRSSTEDALTGGILQLERRGTRRVYLLEGHGERSRTDADGAGLSAAASALRGQGLEVSELNLLNSAEVPDDAAAVLVVELRAALLEPEVAALERYLDRGGRMALFLEPGPLMGLEPLLARWGLRADDDVVLDDSDAARAFANASVALAVPSSSHPATVALARLNLAFPTARSLSAAPGAPLPPSAIAATGKQSRGVLNAKAGGAETARRGPLAVAAAAQREVRRPGGDAEHARLVVVGDSDFCSNAYLGLLSNRQFFVGLVEWLVEKGPRVPIISRARDASRLVQTPAQASALRFVTGDVVPALFLSMGLVVWVLRRGR